MDLEFCSIEFCSGLRSASFWGSGCRVNINYGKRISDRNDKHSRSNGNRQWGSVGLYGHDTPHGVPANT